MHFTPREMPSTVYSRFETHYVREPPVDQDFSLNFLDILLLASLLGQCSAMEEGAADRPFTVEGHRLLCALQLKRVQMKRPGILAKQVEAVWPELAALGQKGGGSAALELLVETGSGEQSFHIQAHCGDGKNYHLNNIGVNRLPPAGPPAHLPASGNMPCLA